MKKIYSFAELQEYVKQSEMTTERFETEVKCIRTDTTDVEEVSIGVYLVEVQEGCIFIDIFEENGREVLRMSADMKPRPKMEVMREIFQR